MKRRIGILTSGGDCPGLNAAIRGVTRAAYEMFDAEIIGIHDGYRGLIEGDYSLMTRRQFSGILTLGGTILGTARTPFRNMQVIGEDRVDKVAALIQNGAKIQMNAGSVLGHEGFRQAKWSRKLLKESMVHVIASDSHDPIDRPPELDDCQRYLRKKVGDAYTDALMRDNPMQILSTREKETIPHANNQAEAREATL